MDIEIQGISVRIEKRNVKNINLYIKPPDGRVLVTAPKYLRKEVIFEFLSSKENWIVKHHKKILEQQKNDRNKSRLISEEQKRNLEDLIDHYRKKWEPALGVCARDFTIRDMKTIWGSCSTKTGRIRINLRLAEKPGECIEYVVVHELCHLLEPSHNQRFHNLMTEFLPDWKQRKASLNGRIEST